jgi:hypothetical protein
MKAWEKYADEPARLNVLHNIEYTNGIYKTEKEANGTIWR